MYVFKKRHLATIALLLFPFLAAFLPDAVTGGIKSQIIFVLKTPIALTDSLSRRIQSLLVPKGFFLSQINNQNSEIKSLQAEIAQARELYLENQRLKELLSFKQGLPFKVLPVQVIAKDPSNWRRTIIVDKGSGRGIKNNAFIVSQQGLAGRVSESGRYAAKAILLTDPNFRVAAICQRSREQAIVAGSGRNLCALKYLSQEADIQVKDVIVTSGIGEFCPKGILIGEVVSVSKSKDGLTQEAYVKPAANLSRLEEALVLLE